MFTFKKIVSMALGLVALFMPATGSAFFGGSVPSAATSIAQQLDGQLMMRYAGFSKDIPRKQLEAIARAKIMLLGTTPANINNLEETNPLSRQFAEELSKNMIAKGYRYQELRRGKHIRVDKKKGELILTRDVNEMVKQEGTGQAVLAGTYIISPEQVRFTVSLIHPTSNEVLAKGIATVPLTDDVMALLEDLPEGQKATGRVPTVFTRLQ